MLKDREGDQGWSDILKRRGELGVGGCCTRRIEQIRVGERMMWERGGDDAHCC